MRKVAWVVPGADEVIGRVCMLDYSAPGKPPIDRDDPAAKDVLVNDALAVLAELAGPGSPQRDAAAADALGLLALVARQDVGPAEDFDGTGGRRHAVWVPAGQGAGVRLKLAADGPSGCAVCSV